MYVEGYASPRNGEQNLIVTWLLGGFAGSLAFQGLWVRICRARHTPKRLSGLVHIIIIIVHDIL